MLPLQTRSLQFATLVNDEDFPVKIQLGAVQEGIESTGIDGGAQDVLFEWINEGDDEVGRTPITAEDITDIGAPY